MRGKQVRKTVGGTEMVQLADGSWMPRRPAGRVCRDGMAETGADEAGRIVKALALILGLAACAPAVPDPALERKAAQELDDAVYLAGRFADGDALAGVYLTPAAREFGGHVIACGQVPSGAAAGTMVTGRVLSVDGARVPEPRRNGAWFATAWDQAGC